MHSAEGHVGDGDGREPRPQPQDAHSHDEELIYGITTAETSHIAEISRRQKQYTLTMMIRVVSIIVVVLVPGLSWQLRVGLCIVATIIPYIAVVRANGGPVRDTDPTNLMVGQSKQGELGPAQHELPTTGERADFIVGEVFREAPDTAAAEAAAETAAAETADSDTPPGASREATGAAGAKADRGTAGQADQGSDQHLTAH